MYPVPTTADLAGFSGRPVGSYTPYATLALAQAALVFTFKTEITDPSQLTGYGALTAADAALLATQGICAYADYLCLRQPYQAAIASPMESETIGSYTYSKPESEQARNAAALEVTGEAIGVPLFDMAVQMLSRRTLAGGVFFGQIQMFERPHDRDDLAQFQVRRDPESGLLHVLGPADLNRVDWPMFDVNGEIAGVDPGVG